MPHRQPICLKDAGNIKKSRKSWPGENNGNWRHISQELCNRQPSALKQAGIGDSQQSTRGTPRIIGAATQLKEKTLCQDPSSCRIYHLDTLDFPLLFLKESKNAILHTSTDPAK